MTNLPEAKPELHKAVLTQNKFVCIEYPGHVKNIDRVLETLGGENAIATVRSHFLAFRHFMIKPY